MIGDGVAHLPSHPSHLDLVIRDVGHAAGLGSAARCRAGRRAEPHQLRASRDGHAGRVVRFGLVPVPGSDRSGDQHHDGRRARRLGAVLETPRSRAESGRRTGLRRRRLSTANRVPADGAWHVHDQRVSDHGRDRHLSLEPGRGVRPTPRVQRNDRLRGDHHGGARRGRRHGHLRVRRRRGGRDQRHHRGRPRSVGRVLAAVRSRRRPGR